MRKGAQKRPVTKDKKSKDTLLPLGYKFSLWVSSPSSSYSDFLSPRKQSFDREKQENRKKQCRTMCRKTEEKRKKARINKIHQIKRQAENFPYFKYRCTGNKEG